jgi:hypothetical protein
MSLWLESWRARIRLDLMRLANDFGRSLPASLSPISFHIFQASSDSSSTSLSLFLSLRQISQNSELLRPGNFWFSIYIFSPIVSIYF